MLFVLCRVGIFGILLLLFVEEILLNMDETVSALLVQWDLGDLIPDFQEKGIDIEVLQELTIEDINRLIPDESFGKRIKFRKQLFTWKEANGYCTPLPSTATASSSNNTLQWIESLPITFLSEQPKLDVFNLSNLLNSTISGQFLIKNYEINKFLSNTDRNIVVSAIADYWISLNRKISERDYTSAIQEIKKIFPTESEKTYSNSKQQRGKLAEKYYSLCKKYRNAGLLKSKYKLQNKTDKLNSSTLDTSSSSEGENDMLSNFEWLKSNNSPEKLVIERWNSTYSLRNKHLSKKNFDIFAAWPILKQNFATTLIELDFEQKYPGKNVLLFAKWPMFCDKIKEIYKRELKDPKNKILLSTLDEVSNEDTKNYTLTILLNGILIPTIIKLKNNKKHYKPSILDAQKSLVLHVPNKSIILDEFERIKAENIKRNWTIQPTIVVVGNLEALTEFYVYLNDVIYHTDSFLKALSVTFQIHHVLNMEYAPQCQQVWNFIEEFFYEIPSSTKKSTSLNALLGELRQ